MEMTQQKTALMPENLSLCSCIKQYAENGYAVFPALENKKPMVSGSWLDAQIDLEPNDFTYPTGMFGVKLREDDLILDLDPRNMKGRKVLSELQALMGEDAYVFVESFCVRTGGGGFHIYMRKPPTFGIRKHLKDKFPGIEFLSSGCYVIGMGSIGYTQYGTVGMAKAMKAPVSLLNLIQKSVIDLAQIQHNGFTNSEHNKGRYIEYLINNAPLAIEGEGGDQTTFTVACRGRDYNLSSDITADIMLQYYNSRCRPPWQNEELKVKVSNAYNYNQDVIGKKDPEIVFGDIKNEDMPKEDPLSFILRQYGDNLDVSKNGMLKPSIRNMERILLSDPDLKAKFGLNEFNHQLTLMDTVPWEKRRRNTLRNIDDNEIEFLRIYVSHVYKVEFTTPTVWKGLGVISNSYAFHPVKEYIEGIKWDGVPRIDNWLHKYCGAEDKEIYRSVGKKFLIGMVRRIYSPGVKLDNMLVLEGAQGIGKSTACAILGGKWYGEAPIDPKDKDVVPYIHSHWVIELGEMVTTKKTDADRLKNFLSRGEDDVRLPYARARDKFPRQSVFIGTVNPDEVGYLSDRTGNRRYWCISCSFFKLDELKRDRDQLIAEAKILCDKGIVHFLSWDQQRIMEVEANMRVASDPWLHQIGTYFNNFPEVINVTTTTVFQDVLGGHVLRLHTGHQRRIAQCLRDLGWTKIRTGIGVHYIKTKPITGENI